MNYFVSSHDAEWEEPSYSDLWTNPFLLCLKKKKNLKRKKKKLLWDCQPAYLQDVSGLPSWWRLLWSESSTIHIGIDMNSVKPTWADEIEALIFLSISKKEHIFIFTKPFKLVWIKTKFEHTYPPASEGPPISSCGLCVLFRISSLVFLLEPIYFHLFIIIKIYQSE